MLDSKLLTFEKVYTNDNGVDMLIKALFREKLLFCGQEVYLMEPPNDVDEVLSCTKF